ncbi:hypothetical protein N9Z44_01820 [Mariniblastus sp.]|nr:hypothetical protein [Mariniblastus sp.]
MFCRMLIRYIDEWFFCARNGWRVTILFYEMKTDFLSDILNELFMTGDAQK